MATPVSVVDLKEDALCPLCKHYLTDPVLMDCGHNFCRGCISDYYVSWKEQSEPLQCPICSSPIQEGKLRPNQQLGSIVEKLKQIPTPKVEKDYLCAKHKEKLNLFCEDDEELVCLICERSPGHESHTVHLAEDAVQKYKAQMHRRLATLRGMKEKVGTTPGVAEKETLDMLVSLPFTWMSKSEPAPGKSKQTTEKSFQLPDDAAPMNLFGMESVSEKPRKSGPF